MRTGAILPSLILAGLVAAAPAPAAKRQCTVASSSTAAPTTTTVASSTTVVSTTTEASSSSETTVASSTDVTTTTSAAETSSAPATTTPASSGGGASSGGSLKKHAVIGYLHSSFQNGAGYIKMSDVSEDWDVINVSFGEPDAPTTGNIHFNLCTTTDCPDAESEADFIAGVDKKVAEGKLVQISIGGQNGQVRLETTDARDKFVETVGAILDKYHFTGLDIDFEGQSISLDDGDRDLKNPTTPVVVNLISALKSLKAKYPSFTLTMAPETFFVQLGVTYYGSGTFGGQDPRSGSFLPIIDAMRDDLTILHTQDYNSGPITGLDGTSYTMGSVDFHVAMTDILLEGFDVAGNATIGHFDALRPDQVGFGVPSNDQAGNGYVDVSVIQNAVSCITSGSNCGAYKPKNTFPDFRGVMAWSINWDNYSNNTFSGGMSSFFSSLA